MPRRKKASASTRAHGTTISAVSQASAGAMRAVEREEVMTAGCRPATAALYGAPLCPAGHLPHKGGDCLSRRLSPIANVAGWRKQKRPSDLPPCGGDVRQDRGGRDGTQ